MTPTVRDEDALREARQVHRPAMDSGQLSAWVFGWSVGLGALWYVAAGFLVCMSPHASHIAALSVAIIAGVQLLLPGMGVRNPGGARGPVILRSALTFSTLVALVGAALMSTAWVRIHDAYSAFQPTPVGILGALIIAGAPVAGVVLACFAFVGRSPGRSAVLSSGALGLALFSLAGPGIAAVAAHGGDVRPMRHGSDAWFVVSVVFGLAALAALARFAARRDALDPARWVEGHITGNALHLGDDVRVAPESFKGYVGPVCAYLPRVPASAPGRGAAPIAADALLPCARTQLPMLLTDTRDAASSLALFLATTGAIAAAVRLAR